MEVRILGPLEVRATGRPLPLGGTKQRAVLAMLVLHANQVVSIDDLVDGLWGQASPDSATNAVQVYISRLRKLLHVDPQEGSAHLLVRRRPGYLLELDAEQASQRPRPILTARARSPLRAAPASSVSTTVTRSGSTNSASAGRSAVCAWACDGPFRSSSLPLPDTYRMAGIRPGPPPQLLRSPR
jgi:DNA-binding winged helix-turn-helix (wHTH) protein